MPERPTLPPGATRFAPGFYEADGDIHVDVPEILAFLGWPDTPANREQIAAMVAEKSSEIWPGTPIVDR